LQRINLLGIPTCFLALDSCVLYNVNENGKLGYVQQVGESPNKVTVDDSETYGSGAFLMAACEVYKLLPK